MGWEQPPSRMLWAGALLLLAALGCPGAARSCPFQLRSCKCVGERPKGLAPARKRVSCSGEELREPPSPRLLPNGTVTLLLSNNKIAILKNGTFFGLHALEKLWGETVKTSRSNLRPALGECPIEPKPPPSSADVEESSISVELGLNEFWEMFHQPWITLIDWTIFVYLRLFPPE